MEVIVVLLFLSLLISGGFLLSFIYQTKSGQFDDTYSPAEKILWDDSKPVQIHKSKTNN